MKRLSSITAALAVITTLAGAGSSAPRMPDPAAPVNMDQENDAAAERSGTYNIPVHGYTSQEAREMASYNAGLPGRPASKALAPSQYRPYADYEQTGYLIMSADFGFSSHQAKFEMAKNLPADAFLVIFTGESTMAGKEAILRDYDSVVPRNRIKVITLPGARNIIWARDAIPVPVLDRENRLAVIDARYFHGFEPDTEISRLFKTGLEKHDYYFEGGNFQANHTGDCMIVNNGRHAVIPDDIFSGLYGCKTLTRLPFIDGIGHVDERARFINEKTIVTDTPAYKDLLEMKGFSVHLLPRPAQPFETYVNSLILNDHVVVPVFGEPTDAQALAVYEKLGLRASSADSVSLSNQGQGSIHCITMTYPRIPIAELLKRLDAKEL